jgi:hypothetical protein
MIFWDGSKIAGILRNVLFVEGICYRYKGRNLLSYYFQNKGFARTVAHIYRNVILFYDDFTNRSNIKYDDKIPIVSEYEDIEMFPERFAIKTKNIDLIRELIARGKRVSWLYPDLFTQAHYLGIFNFEHVFLDPYINTHIIFPTGEVFKSKDVLHFTKEMWQVKYAKKIGLNLADIYNRIDWKKYWKIRVKNKRRVERKCFMGRNMVTNFYNVFSLTYIIWQQSKQNAMTAKNKTVPKD